MRVIPVDTSSATLLVTKLPQVKARDRQTGEVAVDSVTNDRLMVLELVFIAQAGSDMIKVTVPEKVIGEGLVMGAPVEHVAAPGRDGYVFVGPQVGQLRRSNFRDDWVKARKAAGITAGPHFHDLRHTGNTLASTAGASTRELMTRMGHSSSRAALIYQHMTSDRDRALADRLGAMIRDGGGGASG
ncbi:tyrosine-type recombinase/integrase [Streptomyces albogriseolus]